MSSSITEPTMPYRYIWHNLTIEQRTEYGCAARRNRGRFAGNAIHILRCEYVIGIVDDSVPQGVGTVGYEFWKKGKPVLFSARPVCGCTSGQWAGQPMSTATRESVTCTKCNANHTES